MNRRMSTVKFHQVVRTMGPTQSFSISIIIDQAITDFIEKASI